MNIKSIPRFFLGVITTFLPQLVVWQLLYGKFWVSPYVASFERFDFWHPHILGVLFSPENGLILWTPVTLMGFIGLWGKDNKLPLKLMATIVMVELYLVASWSTWWQGASYSGRMFVSALPLLSFGLAALFTKLQPLKFKNITMYWSIILPLCVINALLITYFLLTH